MTTLTREDLLKGIEQTEKLIKDHMIGLEINEVILNHLNEKLKEEKDGEKDIQDIIDSGIIDNLGN